MILEVKCVDYSYRSQREKHILSQVSIGFEEQTFYAVTGASGAGKTTFLSLLAGLDVPVSGTICYDGEDIGKQGLDYHRKHHVSLVFQNYNLIDYLTTEENVRLGGSPRPEELLREVGIPDEAWKRNVLQLASDAKVLLADEPTGNLDEATSAEIISLLKKTAHQLGKCVIVVTHSRQLAEAADTVMEIRDGGLRILAAQ